MSAVSQVFDKLKFQKSGFKFAVSAGFDESLVESGVGYLEQIHVFTTAEVNPSSTPSLLTDLGKLFSPFSSILFTESSSYRLPVFKDDGSEWEFDELVYLTVSKFGNDGSTAKNPPTIICLNNQNSSSPDGFSQSEGSSGGGEGEKDKKSRNGETGDEDDNDNNDSSDNPTGGDPPGGGGGNEETGDEDDNDNNDSSDNPTGGDPPGDGGGNPAASGQDSPREITIEAYSEIHHNQGYNSKRPSQTLTMLGSLTIEVFLGRFCFVLSNKIPPVDET